MLKKFQCFHIFVNRKTHNPKCYLRTQYTCQIFAMQKIVLDLERIKDCKFKGNDREAKIDCDIERICSLWSKAKRELKKKLKENLALKSKLDIVESQLGHYEKDKQKTERRLSNLLSQVTEQQVKLLELTSLRDSYQKAVKDEKVSKLEAVKSQNTIAALKDLNTKLRKQLEDVEVKVENMKSQYSELKQYQNIYNQAQQQVNRLQDDCRRLLELLAGTEKYRDFVAMNGDIGSAEGVTYEASCIEVDMDDNTGSTNSETFRWIPNKATELVKATSEKLKSNTQEKIFTKLLNKFLLQLNRVYKAREIKQLKRLRKTNAAELSTMKRRFKNSVSYRKVVKDSRRTGQVKTKEHGNVVKRIVSKYIAPLNSDNKIQCSGVTKKQANLLSLVETCLHTVDALCEKQH